VGTGAVVLGQLRYHARVRVRESLCEHTKASTSVSVYLRPEVHRRTYIEGKVFVVEGVR
jgi:hypothetical protein